MWRQNCQRAHTHQIPRITEYLDFILWEIWDLAVVLLVLRVAVGDDAGDARFNSGGEIFDRTVDKGCSLAFSTY